MSVTSLLSCTSSVCYIPTWEKSLRPARLLASDAFTSQQRLVSCYATKKRTEGDGTLKIMQDVQSSRQFRQSGVLLGGTFLSASIGVGAVANVLDPVLILITVTAIVVWFIMNTLKYNETSRPLPDTFFEVRKSQIPNAGSGLFALKEILEGTYLMDYGGEILSEEEYFRRYPTGQGRYVASIPEAIPLPEFGKLSEPTYIDGIDPSKSNLSRFMNSKSTQDGANVVWKKQRFGFRAMHFYAAEDLSAGDELCFDYGADYWDAVIEEDEE